MCCLLLQSEETFAVCTNCSRLSCNLKTCDKCGSTLSEDNTALCYSAEPKRARIEPTSSTPNSASSESVNGQGTSLNGSSALTNQATPVPQALYVNKNTQSPQTPTVGENIRPQALYVNLNNPVYPLNRVQQKEKTLSPNRALSASGPTYSTAPPPYTSSIMTSMPPLPSLGQQSQVIQGAPRISSSTGMVAVLNNQPVGSLTPTSTASYIQMTPSSASHPPHVSVASSNRHLPGAQHTVNSTLPTVDPNCITLHAHQIRIGTRKFRPVSPVTIKDDGILFTLKGKWHRCR